MLKTKQQQNTPCPNLFDTAKATPREIFIALNTLTQEIREVKNHRLKAQLEKLEKIATMEIQKKKMIERNNKDRKQWHEIF